MAGLDPRHRKQRPSPVHPLTDAAFISLRCQHGWLVVKPGHDEARSGRQVPPSLANKRRTVFPSSPWPSPRFASRPCRRAERRAADGGRAWRRAAAGDRRRRGRQDGDARPSPRPSGAGRRRPQAHHAGDLLAPRRRRTQPPRPAHPRPPPRARGRRGGDAEPTAAPSIRSARGCCANTRRASASIPPSPSTTARIRPT